ncbi:MAG: PAS domain S-box protein, partial [Desulfobulbaceae bacterium]|nr:PAS domain S-box protein [Desulfobulbaceae bacterium]
GKLFWETPWWSHSKKLQQKLKMAIKKAATGEFSRFETTHPDRDGRLRDFDFSLKPVRDDAGNVTMLIPEGRDITERKLAENALKEKADQVQLLLNSTGEGIYGIDLYGKCTFINPAALQLLGYDNAEELRERKIHNLIHGNHPESPGIHADSCRIYQVLQTGQSRHGNEELFVRKDSSSFPAECSASPVTRNGKILGAVCTFHDITWRKKAEEDVLRFEAMIEQAIEGIILTNTDWIIEYANSAFEKITGYSKEEIIGQHSGILKSGAHDKAFYKEIRETLYRGDTWSGRLINKKKDGTLYEVEASGSPVRNKQGEITHFTGIQKDISNEIKL